MALVSNAWYFKKRSNTIGTLSQKINLQKMRDSSDIVNDLRSENGKRQS